MTIVFTIASNRLIVMAVDSAVTLTFPDHAEYGTGRKAYRIDGVGCVATWGARDGNRIGAFLDRQAIAPATHSIDNLAELVNQYLKEEYRPDERGADEVGYHVAGFSRAGRPCLYHTFWGFDRPRPPDQIDPKYALYNHSPPMGEFRFLYNGRNDLAEAIINMILKELQQGSGTRFDFTTPVGIVQISDVVIRFAAELTPGVGPPFLIFLIAPDNTMMYIKNDTFCRIGQEVITEHLTRLRIKGLPGS